MYVRKFEADSLDEALSEIKRELGPDAIILKTVSNKGLKGAFKKKKIEITAAISEKNYSDKIKVDHVLNDEQKDTFYSNSATAISKDIESHSANSSAKISSYGNIGLNKSVSLAADKPKINKGKAIAIDDGMDLDSFLSNSRSPAVTEREAFLREEKPSAELSVGSPKLAPLPETSIMRQDDKLQQKIDELEEKLFALTRDMKKIERKEAAGLYELRATLKSLDITDSFIQKLIKKACFEFSQEELENPDLIYEFALREMVEVIKVDMPLFSTVNEKKESSITILLSDTSCGQSSMAMKLAALKPNSVIIRKSHKDLEGQFAQKMFNLDIVNVQTIAQVISEIRKAVETKKTIFVDFQTLNREVNETKKFIDGIGRSFDNIEVLTCVSAIHSELYNKKVLNQYKTISTGIVLAQLDLCLNFGAIFNLYEYTEKMPFKFYGTGEVIPDDIEGATAERILAGIFQF